MFANGAKASLTPSQQKLLTEMQRINYGRILDLTVRRGQPVMDPPPQLVREVKFGGENGPRPEAAKADFALKAQVREMLTQLEALGDGIVE
ncbi:MAG: hypothetical protein ACOC8H_00240, partial [bacterium]